jgi:hypothetical protein
LQELDQARREAGQLRRERDQLAADGASLRRQCDDRAAHAGVLLASNHRRVRARTNVWYLFSNLISRSASGA